MARITLKSQAIVIAQLEAQVAELTTQVGVLMNQLEASNQRAKSLQDERDDLIIENERLTESCIAAHERCDALEAIVAAKPAPKPVPTQVELAPVISITDADKRVWAKFQSLPREQKQAYYDFAHSNGFGHLGIHNVNQVRVAFLAAKAS